MNDGTESPASLRARVDAALAARRPRSPREIATTLARAATRWVAAPGRHALADAQRTSAAMIDAALDAAAGAITVDALVDLAEREWGAGAADRPVPDDGPTLIGHVLASNVPALAIPAIAHALLLGAAVVLKSGRADRWSATAFTDAVAAEDADLAATIVATYWPGGDPAREAAAFERAACVVGTGRDDTVADLGARVGPRFSSYGDRTSLCVVARDAQANVAALAASIARDVALHEQRGCLSPHAVFVEGASDRQLVVWSEAIGLALDALAERWPPDTLDLAARAAIRAACDDAEWAAGAHVRSGHGGIVIRDPRPTLLPPIGCRTIRVQPLSQLDDLPALLPPGRVESIGVAGDVRAILPALRDLGVSRVCPLGRMQAPPIGWPRGQRPPLAALRGIAAPATMLVEP